VGFLERGGGTSVRCGEVVGWLLMLA
jgi:hypothetical protein